MLKTALIVAALAIAATPAHARNWYTTTLNANACQNKDQLISETIVATQGRSPLFGSPEELIGVIRYLGGIPSYRVTKTQGDDVMVWIKWRSAIGQNLERVFYSSLAECRAAVETAIASGMAVRQEQLR